MCGGKIEFGDKLAWNHTGGIMGIIHNTNAKKQVGFDFYNPYVKKKSKPGSTVLNRHSISALKAMAKKGRGLKKNG